MQLIIKHGNDPKRHKILRLTTIMMSRFTPVNLAEIRVRDYSLSQYIYAAIWRIFYKNTHTCEISAVKIVEINFQDNFIGTLSSFTWKKTTGTKTNS